MATTDTPVQQLIINKLTKAQYNTITPSDTELYFVTDDAGISSADVIAALGYTPYNSTNPSGYISGITSGMVTTALGYTPYNSSNPNGYITSSSLPTVMTGATSVAAGATGLVPQPAAGDDAKFLRGDGTWAEAGGSQYAMVITDYTV